MTFEHDVKFRPLGGDVYQDRFWPLSEAQLDTIEEVIGWPLPDDYRAYALEYGVAHTMEYMRVRRDDDIEAPELWVLHGAAGSYSVYDNASHRVGDGFLLIAHSDTGYFYMRKDGSIYFEWHWGPEQSAVLASSFTDLLDRLYLDEE